MTLETADRAIYRYKRNWREGRAKERDKNQRGFGLVEKMFYYYNSIRKEVEAIRAERGYYQNGHKEGGSGSGHSFISNPTEQIAIRHIAPIASIIINADKLNEEIIKQPERWLMVVEQTLMFFSSEELVSEVLTRRFLKNENIRITCCALDISESKYYRLRDAGVSYARECAIQLGLIKIFEYNKLEARK